MDEVIVLQHNESRTLNLENINNEVIVDTNCGAAILRGANIYAPGVMAMTSGKYNKPNLFFKTSQLFFRNKNWGEGKDFC